MIRRTKAELGIRGTAGTLLGILDKLAKKRRVKSQRLTDDDTTEEIPPEGLETRKTQKSKEALQQRETKVISGIE